VITIPSGSQDQIVYTILSQDQVRSDRFFLAIYQGIYPSLPSTLSSLSIKKYEKGIFSNGTISYRVYYGDSCESTSYYVTIFFDPILSRVFYLMLTKIQQPQPSTHTSPPQTCPNGSDKDSQEVMQLKFTNFVTYKHPELAYSQLVSVSISVTGDFATCWMTYLLACRHTVRLLLYMTISTG
jgi:hypothetical protein